MSKQSKHLCDTCKHQIRGMQNGCRAGIHELGLVWQCMSYEYYGPSRQDIDEALSDAGNTKSKQIGGDHYSKKEASR